MCCSMVSGFRLFTRKGGILPGLPVFCGLGGTIGFLLTLETACSANSFAISFEVALPSFVDFPLRSLNTSLPYAPQYTLEKLLRSVHTVSIYNVRHYVFVL